MPILITTNRTYIIIIKTMLIILNRAEYIKIGTVITVQTIFSTYPDYPEFILINRCNCWLRDAIFYSECLKMDILCEQQSGNQK